MKIDDYFVENNEFKFIDKLREGPDPWSAIALIPTIIEGFLKTIVETGMGEVTDYCSLDTLNDESGRIMETSLLVKRTFILSEETMLPPAIFIGEGTMLEAGAIIKSPCIIGKSCEIRQGAYMRGNVIVGDNSVIGHVTEIKNSIVMDHSAAGHFAYIGDSIIGSHVNLGAGTKLANLQFRTREELDENRINRIMIRSDGKEIDTGLKKFGAIIGDYSEIGCNTVTCPATCIGVGSWVYPNSVIPKGFYEPKSVIRK